MKTKILAALLGLLIFAAGCGGAKNSGSSDGAVKLDSIEEGIEYFSEQLKLEENYNPFYDQEGYKSFAAKNGEKTTKAPSNEVIIEGKKSELGTGYEAFIAALDLKYSGEPLDNQFSEGGIEGVSVSLPNQKADVLAVYCEKGQAVNKGKVIGFSLSSLTDDGAVAYTLAGLSNGATAAEVVKKLGNPGFVAVGNDSEEVRAEFQYDFGGRLIIYFDSTLTIDQIILEIEA